MRTEYIAFDGKRFWCEIRCRAHEERLRPRRDAERLAHQMMREECDIDMIYDMLKQKGFAYFRHISKTGRENLRNMKKGTRVRVWHDGIGCIEGYYKEWNIFRYASGDYIELRSDDHRTSHGIIFEDLAKCEIVEVEA